MVTERADKEHESCLVKGPTTLNKKYLYTLMLKKIYNRNVKKINILFIPFIHDNNFFNFGLFGIPK